MGKHKHKDRGGGGGGYFAAYMASLPPEPTMSNEADGGAGNDGPCPDSMKVSTLLEQIGKERSWEDDKIEADIVVCEDNRLYFVRDLRILSQESWKEIQLLPIVKDLIRSAINRGIPSKKDLKRHKKHKNHKEKKDKKKMKDPAAVSSTEPQEPGESEGVQESSKKVAVPPAEKTSSSSSSVSSSSDYDSEPDPNPSVPAASLANQSVRRSIQPVSATRIRVTTASGTTFECDRKCPHKGVDLASWGTLLGNTLVCTKHSWAFNLENQGTCRNGRGVNACRVNDW